MKYNNHHYHKLSSVSPACSRGTLKNENESALANSIVSHDRLKESASTRQHSTNNNSSSSLYAAKLESKIL